MPPSPRSDDPLLTAQHVEDSLLAHSIAPPVSQLSQFPVCEDVTLSVVDNASQLLAQNSSDDDFAKHQQDMGWGVPTSLCQHPKFVLVGTSRGMVLVFDHFGALRSTLSESLGKPVTCIDAVGAQVAVAYDDGRVALFDIASKQVLKAMEAATPGEPIIFCKLVRPWCVVSVTSRGVTWITTYTKLFVVVAADRKCLFDGGLVSSCVAHVEARLLAITLPAMTVIADLSDDAVPKIAHRWPSSGNNPSPAAAAAWGPGSSTLKLARGWAKRVELLERRDGKEWVVQCTATLDNVVCACEFANEARLAVLLDTYQIRLLDTASGTVVGQCDASQLAQIVVSTRLDVGAIYQNSMARADDGLIYLLGLNELALIKLQAWTKHIDRLASEGRWPEALAVAMNHYRKTVITKAEQEQQLMSAIRDGSRVAEVFEDYLSALDVAGMGDDAAGSACDLCIEYAMGISRVDLIFNRVLELYAAAGKSHVYFTRLVPFVVNNVLPTLSPIALNMLNAHLVRDGRAKLFELVVLHLDVTAGQLDLDLLVRTLRAERLFTGLCHVYNRGLGEYVAPLKAMLEHVAADAADAEVGHRVLLYLKYCFLGIAFPRGIMPERDQVSCATDLLRFLFVHDGARAAEALLGFDARTLCRVVQTALDSPFYRQEPSRDVVFAAMLRAAAWASPARASVLNLVSSYAQRDMVTDAAIVDVLVDHLVREGDEDALIALLERQPPKPGLAAELDARGLFRVAALVHRLYSRDPGKVMDAYLRCPDAGFAKLVFPFCLSSETSEVAAPALERADALVALDVAQSTALFAHLSSHEAVLDSLHAPGADEAYLNEIIKTVQVVSPALVSRFLRLLVRKHPEQVHTWLSSNEARYALDVALEACQGHVEATAYLLERAGRPDEALDLVLSAGVRTRLSAVVACELCERNPDEGDLWFRVLDNVVAAGASEELVGVVLERMLPHVPLGRVLDTISNDFFRFQRALADVGMAFKLQLGALQAAKRVAEADEFALGARRRAETGRGARVKPVQPAAAATSSRQDAMERAFARRARESEYEQLRWQAVGESGGQVDAAQVLLLGTGYELRCRVTYKTASA